MKRIQRILILVLALVALLLTVTAVQATGLYVTATIRPGCDGATNLTDLTITLDPQGAATYEIANFANITEDIATDNTNLTITQLDATNAANLALTADTGNVAVTSFDTTGAGTLALTATTGNITLADGAMVTGAGAVTVTATAGTIDESDDTATTNITTTGLLTLTANGAIGVSGGTGPLDIDVGSLIASVTGVGGIFIENNDGDSSGLTLTDVDTVNGNIEIRSEDAIVAADVVANGDATIIADSGNITSSTIDGIADVQGSTVTLVVTGAGNDIGTSAAAPLEINAVTLNASTAGAVGDDIFLDDTADGLAAGLITAGDGNVDIDVLNGANSISGVTNFYCIEWVNRN